jgi:hypothetical protein
LPQTTSKQYRLIFSDIKNPQNQISVGGIREIVLSSHPKVENFIEKQMAKMLQTPDLSWGEYLWKPQLVNGTKDMFIDASKVVNLSNFDKRQGVETGRHHPEMGH